MQCTYTVLGVPEGLEGSDPVKFCKRWIPEHLQIKTTTGHLKLDRAHRSLMPRPDPSQRPRPPIVKFHNFMDKCWVMEATLHIGSLPLNREISAWVNLRISFFNDYVAEVVQRCKAFDGLKARLRKRKVGYSLKYPATLHVKIDGKQQRLDSPEEVASFIGSLEGGNGGIATG